ncbi:MAG: Ig-like domain-containing protein [Candidatus Kapaibacterium sp.]
MIAGRVFRIPIRVLLLLWIAGCASIQPPPGGPEDKTPPALLESTPKERATNVSRDVRIHFLFAAPLDKNTFSQSFSITPYITGKLKFSWSGSEEVEVRLPELLRENTTYTVSLARDLKSRRGNALAQPVHLTFSTGAAIDTGRLNGVLLPALNSKEALKTADIFLFAYDLRAHTLDTLDLSHTPPDLMTQADDKGAFEFLAMRTSGKYRVFAVRDAFRNHVYDKGVDGFGVPTSDLVLDSSFVTDFRIRMAAAVDTVPPQLQDAEVLDAYHLRAKFSEELDTLSIRPNVFQLRSTKQNTPIELVAAYRDHPDRRIGQVVLLTKSPLISDSEYTLSVLRDSVHDLAGNKLWDSAYQTTLSGRALRDTFPAPRISETSISDSLRDVSQSPSIRLTFSDAVAQPINAEQVTLIDTSKKSVPIQLVWTDDAHLIIRPVDSLRALQFYTLTLRTKAFSSPLPSRAVGQPDTLIRIRFQTVDPREEGKVAGEVGVADSAWKRNPNARYVVELIGSSSDYLRRVQLPQGSATYEFDRVPMGKYRVRGYIVEGANGRFDAGSVIPYKFSAPSGDFPTEIDVRPRWTIDKVNILLK